MLTLWSIELNVEVFIKWFRSRNELKLFTYNLALMSPSGYRQISNIGRTLVGNKIVDHSDVVGAAPAGVHTGTASTTSSFLT